jgi:hypothetical protein
MEPEIRINDLAYFQKIDNQYPLAAGDIILFAENSTLYVERIREQAGSYLIVASTTTRRCPNPEPC